MDNDSKLSAAEQRDHRAAAQRIKPRNPMTVRSKTLGTDLVYKLEMENVSKTGMLLNYPLELKLPFRENTILELTIDPDSSSFPSPVSCIGKVVRKVSAHSRSDVFQIGISIVQIDADSQLMWENHLDDMR